MPQKKLADCWADNIGPNEGQIVWWDEHQGMEQALVRFGRFVNDMEGEGKGDRYIALAKFLWTASMVAMSIASHMCPYKNNTKL